MHTTGEGIAVALHRAAAKVSWGKDRHGRYLRNRLLRDEDRLGELEWSVLDRTATNADRIAELEREVTLQARVIVQLLQAVPGIDLDDC